MSKRIVLDNLFIPDNLKAKFLSQGLCGIYKAINLKNNKFYVGSSIDIEKRVKEHLRSLRKNKHHSIYLQRSWNKHKEESFIFMFIEETNPDTRLSVEQWYLDNEECQYNVSTSATSAWGGRKMPEEHCMMLSDMRTGELNSMYGKRGENHPAFGNTHSDESKAAIGAGHCTREYVGITPTGEIVEFDNAAEFGRFLGVEGANITGCCTGKFKTVKDWVFMYAEDYDPNITGIEYLKNAWLNNARSNGRYIRAISPNDEEFDVISVPRFAEKYDLDPSSIRKCCNGKYTNTKGWKFYYIVEKPLIELKHKPVECQITYKGISPLGVEHIFTNAKDFAKDNKLNSYAISKCCRGTMRKHYGWTFEYVSHTDFDSIAA